MRLPLLLMRKRGLLGSLFGHHSGVTHLSKSVGSFIALGADQLAQFLQGWTGLKNCYKPVFARFNGTDNYLISAPIPADNHGDEGTIFIAFTPKDLGIGNVKFYDIGDGVTNSDFTTRIRLRFNGGGTGDIRVVLADSSYTFVADVQNILSGSGANQWRFDEPNYIYIAYKNDNIDGVGQSRIQVSINGSLFFDDTFENTNNGDGAKQIGFNMGDNIIIGARHNLSSDFYNWDMGEIFSVRKFLDHNTFIDQFINPSPRTGFPNGTPVGRVTGSAVGGVIPSNHFGGLGYTIADWNAGNNGVGSFYTRNGAAFIEGTQSVWGFGSIAEGVPADQILSLSGMENTAIITGGANFALYGKVPDERNVSDGVFRLRYRTTDITGSLQAREVPGGVDFGGGHLIVADGAWQEWIVSVPVPSGTTQVLIRALTNLTIGTMECQLFWDTLPTGGITEDVIYEMTTSKPVSWTDATGISFTIDSFPFGAELMPDESLDGACGDGMWTCNNGLGTTTISGGQASISPIGNIELASAMPTLDPSKFYTTTIVCTQVGTVNPTIFTGGTGSTTTVLLVVGTNIISGLTGLLVGGGTFRINPGFADADPNTIVTSWSIKEENVIQETATNVQILPGAISPSNLIPFMMDWVNPPVSGQVVAFDYDGFGNLSYAGTTITKNGTFATGDTTDWTLNIDGLILYTVANNFLTMFRNGGGTPSITQFHELDIGTTYIVSFEIFSGSIGDYILRMDTDSLAENIPSDTGVHSYEYTATATSQLLRLFAVNSATATLVVSNISIGEKIPLEAQTVILTNCLDSIAPSGSLIDTNTSNFLIDTDSGAYLVDT